VTVLDLPTAYFHLLTAELPSAGEIPTSLRLVIVGGEEATRRGLDGANVFSSEQKVAILRRHTVQRQPFPSNPHKLLAAWVPP
jgi:hypothetical protein